MSDGILKSIVTWFADTFGNPDSNEYRKRMEIPCEFSDGITQTDFNSYVVESCKQITRLTSLKVKGPFIQGTVLAQSGLSEWDFLIDFNDYGRITGKYWITSENEDSNIPNHIADKVKDKILCSGMEYRKTNPYKDYKYSEFKKTLKHLLILFAIGFSIYLASWAYLSYDEHKNGIPIGISSENIIGKQYSEIVSELKHNGFNNIILTPEQDLDFSDIDLENHVSGIRVNGKENFDEEVKFLRNAKVEIKYHVLKEIPVTVSAKEAKKMNYKELEEKLRETGFSNISLIKDCDLITGWITKDGSVEELSMGGETRFETNTEFRPDIEIKITYHTFKEDE